MVQIKVTKLTDVNLLRLANSFTSGKESKMSLAKAYAYRHSPIRTQMFAIELTDIPLFVASQLVRSHVGVQWYQRSKRTDRGGEDFRIECYDFGQTLDTLAEYIDADMPQDKVNGIITALDEMETEVKSWANKFDRYAPTDLLGVLNAEAIINMSHKRLCTKASLDTRAIWAQVVNAIRDIDPDLANHCVPQCVYCGFCSEPKGCGWIKSQKGMAMRNDYLKLFE